VVECQLPKLDVVGSSPISRSNLFNEFQTPQTVAGSVWLHLIHYQRHFEAINCFTSTG
jgi:hypothetical protein